MALFGKKKKAEQNAPVPSPEDEIQVVGGDADETDVTDDGDGQVIDFDSIADELNDDSGGSELGEPMDDTEEVTTGPMGNTVTVDLSKEAESDDDLFETTPGFEAGTAGNAGLDADDELDFDSVFDEGSPAPDATADATINATTAQTDENPFGGGAPTIEPKADVESLTTDVPPLTNTAPMMMSDVAAGDSAPAVKKSLPLLPLLGAAGLLLALGAVAYMTLGKSAPVDETAPIVAANPALETPATGTNTAGAPATATTDTATTATGAPITSAPDGGTPDLVPLPPADPPGVPPTRGAAPVALTPSNAVNPGIAVDGVPIAPGIVVQQAPVGGSPLQAQLKALWNKGASAKRSDDFAGARAAWTEILRLDPGHKGIQEAIDKLPPA